MLEKMLSWDPETYCITEWRVPGRPQPLSFIGWGAEVGNCFGFFSHEFLGGIACRIENRQLENPSPTKLGSRWQIRLPQARLNLQMVDELILPRQIIRHLTVATLSEKNIAWIADAVIRLVVPWEEGLIAELEGKEIIHQNTNFYYDTEGPEVSLRWADGRRLVVRWLEKPYTIPALTPYLYVRDRPAMRQYNHYYWSLPAWVIHARLLVDYPAALVMRLWRNPLVFWSRGLLGRYVLGRVFMGRFSLKNLWRAGEWHPERKCEVLGRPLAPFIFGIWPLMPGQTLYFP